MHILPHSSKGKFIGLFALALAGVCYSLCKGAIPLSPGELLSGLTSSIASGGSLSMIMHLRMVRIASALLCGSALSLSGSLLQQTLNNPMAGPSLLGINASAALSVMLGMLLFPSLAKLLPLFSSVGALVGSLIVFSPCIHVSIQPTYPHTQWYCLIYSPWCYQRHLTDYLSRPGDRES
nr:iron chelate uptake ABC transporter family permease subunit [uncultured Sphaerochaeta sp.]